MGSVSFLDPLLFQNSSTKIPYESYFKTCGRRYALTCMACRAGAKNSVKNYQGLTTFQ
jgi:hypothetical protein